MNTQAAVRPGAEGSQRTQRRGWRLLASVGAWVLLALFAFLIWPVKFGGHTSFVFVSGESMHPTYEPGDLVIAWKREPNVGDVIIYAPEGYDGAQVVHRIIGGDAEAGWAVQGDNNDFIDPFTPQGAEVRGVVLVHIPNVAPVMNALLSPYLWVGLFLVAAAVMVWPGKDASHEDNHEQDDAELPATEPELIGGR